MKINYFITTFSRVCMFKYYADITMNIVIKDVRLQLRINGTVTYSYFVICYS